MRGHSTTQIGRARRLRREMTEAERKLWYAVRDRRMAGFKFVRQEPIGPYVADFCCREAKLVVELDGSQHAERRRDKIRDEQLIRLGYRVLRFWNHEALLTMDIVLETIFARLTGRS
jgi:very-short-patch-repair endonuclease